MRGLPIKVKRSLEKAKDVALLSVEIYNKPAIKFKSGGYITLMIIAWTALFHSIFYKRKIKPYYKKSGRFIIHEGDFRYWELDECLRNYFKTDTANPIRKNLEFFIPLRNKIEHKSLPEIDSDIFGECQAMLLNFDAILETEYGETHCLRESLSFSLQLFPSRESLHRAITKDPTTKSVIDFINAYRSGITAEIFESNKYAFKAFLIQVANHNSANALPIQFMNYDKLTDEQKEELGKFVAMVKYKSMPVSNEDMMKAREVVRLVQASLGNKKIQKNKKEIDKFNMSTHTRCWKKYDIRPTSNSTEPHITNNAYCIYDKPHKDYLYNQEWVDYLIVKMADDNEYNTLFSNQELNDEDE